MVTGGCDTAVEDTVPDVKEVEEGWWSIWFASTYMTVARGRHVVDSGVRWSRCDSIGFVVVEVVLVDSGCRLRAMAWHWWSGSGRRCGRLGLLWLTVDVKR